MKHLVALYAESYFRGADRVLLVHPGMGLPQVALPPSLSPSEFVVELSREVFGQTFEEAENVGTIYYGDSAILHVVTSIPVVPRKHTSSSSVITFDWHPIESLPNEHSVQDLVVALCRRRLSGWKVDVVSGTEYGFSFSHDPESSYGPENEDCDASSAGDVCEEEGNTP